MTTMIKKICFFSIVSFITLNFVFFAIPKSMTENTRDFSRLAEGFFQGRIHTISKEMNANEPALMEAYFKQNGVMDNTLSHFGRVLRNAQYIPEMKKQGASNHEVVKMLCTHQ